MKLEEPRVIFVEGLGFRVSGLGFRVWGLGFRVWGLGQGLGLRFRAWSLGLRGFWVCMAFVFWIACVIIILMIAAAIRRGLMA